MDQIFFQDRDALGNLILWPLIMRVSLCKQRHLQTYNQSLWFGCKPITHKRWRDIFIQLSFFSKLAWNAKGHIVTGPGSQSEVGWGRGRVTGFNGYFILLWVIFESWPFISINHQMCSRPGPDGVLLHVPINLMLSLLPCPFIRWESRGQGNDLLLLAQLTNSIVRIRPLPV